jgi:hypothetical protein
VGTWFGGATQPLELQYEKPFPQSQSDITRELGGYRSYFRVIS